MRLCNILIEYFLLIYFCYSHDLNHADPVTVKKVESAINIDSVSKTTETTNENSNHAQITPSVDVLSTQNQVPISIQTDIKSPSTSEQIKPLITDTIKVIPISNDKSNLNNQSPIVQTQIINNNNQENQLKEETAFVHTQSHIPTFSSTINPLELNSDQQPQIPLKSTQTTTTNDNAIVENESQSSTIQPPQKIHIHPRHIQAEDRIITEKSTTEQSITIENKIQTNDIPVKPNASSTKEDLHLSRNQTTDNNNTTQTNHSISISSLKNRQICWHLPKKFQPSIELLENQLFRFITILPDFLQTIFFEPIDDREILMNTMWFSSICTMCGLFSFLFLSMGTKRLKQSKHEKEVRSRCQQLQQYNNQIELERATFERQNQKLSEQIDELKNLTTRDTDEDIFVLRKECNQFQDEIKTIRIERNSLQQDIDQKENLIQKYEYETKAQIEMIANLNNQILQLKQDLEKERSIINRLQSNDLSLENFEKSQEIIQQLKTEILELKQEKFTDKDQLQELHEYSKQINIENNQLTIRMKQLKDLLEQRNQIIKTFHEKLQTSEHIESNELILILNENSYNQEFLSLIDNDIKKSNQHINNLHKEIDEKTHHINEIENLYKQEKDRCREIETKLKVVLELRERDAHLHIRQLGQTDAELRKARTDTDRVRILQQQLELKQKQFDDIQKLLTNEQIKFNEESIKLQHEIHEKWMDVKRLTRDLDGSKKECEGLRKQITKYAYNERSSQDKSMIKPIPQHFDDSESSSISSIPFQQAENFRPIDYQRNGSGAGSPTEMFIPRPPLFGLSRPPFFPPPFMQHPPPNPFMMHPRFPMATSGSHGILSPISNLMINGNDLNNSEMNDSSNFTPNSISCDAQSNEIIDSPVINDEKQLLKTKKSKKSLKKKTRTSAIIEDV